MPARYSCRMLKREEKIARSSLSNLAVPFLNLENVHDSKVLDLSCLIIASTEILLCSFL